MYKIRQSFEKESVEMRKAYCETLISLAEKDERIVLMDADLINSHGTRDFFKKFPERAIDCGIQENNMVGMASGLSTAGMIPYVHSFAPFVARRCNDQIFISCCYAGLHVNLFGSDPGVEAALNGGTHMPFEDMGCLMAFPGITLLEPTDTVMMRWLTGWLREHYGVHYVRMLRKNAVGVYEEGSSFEIGKAPVIRDGKDVAIFASGIMVGEALEAVKLLESRGISAALLDAFCWKPLDEQAVERYAQKCGCIVTAENHNIVGGLGAAIASAASRLRPVPVEMVGVRDEFGQVGKSPWLREQYGLTARDIAAAAERAIARKG